jgi:hypothetical protein
MLLRMGALAHLETKSVPVTPDGAAVAEIRVRNSGKVVDQFSLRVLGDAQGWAVVDPPVLSLFPGAEEKARVTFRPPRSFHVPAGPMPFGVRVDSQQDPANSATEEGVLQIAPFVETQPELTPRRVAGSRSATYELTLENRGNARISASLSTFDAERQLEFEVPASIVADPGQMAVAQVLVRPRDRFLRGEPKSRPFRLLVHTPGTPPVALDATLDQQALLPPWLAQLVVAGLLILRNLPAIIFIGIVIPLGLRLLLQLVEGSALEDGHPLRSYTDIFAGPFRRFELPQAVEDATVLDWNVAEWYLVVALVTWALVWFALLIATRLFRK